jgi:hypothetical protein
MLIGGKKMARTIRVFWRKRKSGWLNFNWNGVITPNSVVHISACEASESERNMFGVGGMNRVRNGRVIDVKNVRPHGPNPGDNITGGVEFYVDIGQPFRFMSTPVDIVTDITVFDSPEDLTAVG